MEEKRSPRRLWLLLVAILAGLVMLGGTYTALAGPPPSASPGEQLSAGPSAVAWSSGWVALAQGETRTFTHALGLDPDQYAVELWFLDTDDGWGINRRWYGGVDFNGQELGAAWKELTSNTIQVVRSANDRAADKVRVMVWVPAARPSSDSGWVGINQAQNITFTFDLGVAVDDLAVSLWFSGTNGIHHIAYGSKSVAGSWIGANWHHLTNTSVQVVRRAADLFVDQVRVQVTYPETPTYDSTWVDINPGQALTLAHGLNWPPELLVARGECKKDPGPGIHQMFSGGNHSSVMLSNGWQGANLQNVTSNTITIFRWFDDTVCPQGRVRIWERAYAQAIPIVTNE